MIAGHEEAVGRNWGFWESPEAPLYPMEGEEPGLLILLIVQGRINWQIPELGQREVEAGQWSILKDHRPASALHMEAGAKALWLRLQMDPYAPATLPPKLECIACPSRNTALFAQGPCCAPCRKVLHKIEDQRPTSLADHLHAQSRVMELGARIMERPELQAVAPCHQRICARDQQAIEAVARFLEENMDQVYTLSDLSRRFFINEFKLKKLFKEHFGQPVFSYLRACRMAKAAELLEHRGYTVLEAAAAVGYSNPSHFARAFRKVHGINPGRIVPWPASPTEVRPPVLTRTPPH